MEVIEIIMDVKTILTIVGTCIGIVAYIIVTICAVKRKKAKGEPIDVTTVFEDIASKALVLVKEAEKNYASVPNGGKLKLKDVLNDIKDLCSTAGISFDKPTWTAYIAKAVELINIDRKPAETPTETTAEAK